MAFPPKAAAKGSKKPNPFAKGKAPAFGKKPAMPMSGMPMSGMPMMKKGGMTKKGTKGC